MDVRIARQAESDLDEIWYLLATQSSNIDVADRVIDSVTARFALIARQPYIGRRRDEDLRPGVRSFVVGDSVIAYRVDGEARGHRFESWRARRIYYPLHGSRVSLPNAPEDAPEGDYLHWHNEQVSRASRSQG